MVALTFNDLRTEQKATGRAQGTEHSPAQQGSNSVAQGRARQLSKGISPPFKTCLGSSKERTIFFYVTRTYCIVFITGLQLIWCLLLFCSCTACSKQAGTKAEPGFLTTVLTNIHWGRAFWGASVCKPCPLSKQLASLGKGAGL